MNVREDASDEVIRKKAIVAFKKNHPNGYLDPKDKEYYTKQFIEVNDAYQFIKNYK